MINTGSRATIDPIAGLIEARPLTHIEALELDHIPDHLLVLGGGYVGLELAQAIRRLGSRVTVIERNGRLAHREDPDISEAIHDLCRDEGIEVVVSATRALDAAPDSTPRTAQVIARLGEPIFGHQAPNGYSETGDAWINTGLSDLPVASCLGDTSWHASNRKVKVGRR